MAAEIPIATKLIWEPKEAIDGMDAFKTEYTKFRGDIAAKPLNVVAKIDKEGLVASYGVAVAELQRIATANPIVVPVVAAAGAGGGVGPFAGFGAGSSTAGASGVGVAAAAAGAVGGPLAYMGTRGTYREYDIATAAATSSGGYWGGMGARQLPFYSQPGQAWANQEYPFQGEEFTPLFLPGPGGGGGAGGGGGGGGFSGVGAGGGGGGNTFGQFASRDLSFKPMNLLGQAIPWYIAYRILKAGVEFADKESQIGEQEFAAENMPSRTTQQRVRKADAMVRAAQKDVDETSEESGGVQALWANARSKLADIPYFDKRFPSLGDASYRDQAEEKLKNAQIDLTMAQQNQQAAQFGDYSTRLQTQAGNFGLRGFVRESQGVVDTYQEDLKKLKDSFDAGVDSLEDLKKAENALLKIRADGQAKILEENQAYLKKNELQNEVIRASEDGNRQMESQLQLMQRINETRETMNEKIAGSGDTWAGTVGAGMQQSLNRELGRANAAALEAGAENIVDAQARTRIMTLRSKGLVGHAAEVERENKYNQEDLAAENKYNESVFLPDPNNKSLTRDLGKMSNDDALSAGFSQNQWDQAQDAKKLKDETLAGTAAQRQADQYKQDQSLKDVQEHTKELRLEASGNDIAAQREKIKYQYEQEIMAAPNDQFRQALVGERDAAIANVNRHEPFMGTAMQSYNRLQMSILRNADANGGGTHSAAAMTARGGHSLFAETPEQRRTDHLAQAHHEAETKRVWDSLHHMHATDPDQVNHHTIMSGRNPLLDGLMQGLTGAAAAHRDHTSSPADKMAADIAKIAQILSGPAHVLNVIIGN